MSNAHGSNAKLKHITILEEAHNLLKRSNAMPSAEGANLVGKSVEMIANAIAEMRTYGEGFVIVDQAPGLLDMATIRNTNTKIIMRLPDQGDRELVGRAANLNDDQIREICKLLESGKYTHKEIGNKFGVSRAVIGNIYQKKIHTDISKDYNF